MKQYQVKWQATDDEKELDTTFPDRELAEQAVSLLTDVGTFCQVEWVTKPVINEVNE